MLLRRGCVPFVAQTTAPVASGARRGEIAFDAAFLIVAANAPSLMTLDTLGPTACSQRGRRVLVVAELLIVIRVGRAAPDDEYERPSHQRAPQYSASTRAVSSAISPKGVWRWIT